MERDACNYSFLNMYHLKHNTRQTSVVTLGNLLGSRVRGTAPGGSGSARGQASSWSAKDRHTHTHQPHYLASNFLTLEMKNCASIEEEETEDVTVSGLVKTKYNNN